VFLSSPKTSPVTLFGTGHGGRMAEPLQIFCLLQSAGAAARGSLLPSCLPAYLW
jgi:hypothetical protein